jgi:alpha-beta hydrolase superfamily lysophospholipase
MKEMPMPNRVMLAAIVLISAGGIATADTYRRADGVMVDAKVLDARGCAPLVIISHGLGGSLSGNAPLATALNRAGYRVVVPSHGESGRDALRSALLSGRPRIGVANAASDPAAHRARMADLDAILAVENRRCAVPFRALAGHSMGARTTLIEAGATSTARIAGQNRFDAYIAISPQGEGNDFFPAGAMRALGKPVLMITGTEDRSVDGGYETRLSTFDGLPPGRKRLAVIEGATHGALGGRNDARVGAMVGVIAVEFLSQIRPGPWGAPGRRAGVTFADK